MIMNAYVVSMKQTDAIISVDFRAPSITIYQNRNWFSWGNTVMWSRNWNHGTISFKIKLCLFHKEWVLGKISADENTFTATTQYLIARWWPWWLQIIINLSFVILFLLLQTFVPVLMGRTFSNQTPKNRF